MNEIEAETLGVGQGAAARDIAVLRRPGAEPGLFWLGGFASDMRGSKAEALDAYASDFQPITDMRASADYRMLVARNLLKRFFMETTSGLAGGKAA